MGTLKKLCVVCLLALLLLGAIDLSGMEVPMNITSALTDFIVNVGGTLVGSA
jgi:hypothetical protein